MTPKMAAEILLRSTGQRQRATSQPRVQALASAMKRGQWQVTHQTIALDPAGVLLDGKHRLEAVVAAGIPVTMRVTYDVDPATFDVIDTGRSRAAGDVLRIAGYGNQNLLAANVRHILMLPSLIGNRRTITAELRMGVTTVDIVNFMESPRGEVLLSKLSVAGRVGTSVGRPGIRSWLPAVLTLIQEAGTDRTLLLEWEDRLESGAMLPTDSPVMALRRWLTSPSGYIAQQTARRTQAAMGCTLRAWDAWLSGRSLSSVRFTVGVDIMPQPLAHRPDPEELAEAVG